MEKTITPLDFSHLEGGLVRMMRRFEREGTMTGELEADEFLRRSPEGTLLGMLYDQRVRAEYAFTGPIRLKERLGHLDLKKIAAMDVDELRSSFAMKPAVHRFTNRMAELTHKLAGKVSQEYGGMAANIWNDGASRETVKRRVQELPGFGALKAEKMTFALHYFGHRDFTKE